jgi:hypothetical protein
MSVKMLKQSSVVCVCWSVGTDWSVTLHLYTITVLWTVSY